MSREQRNSQNGVGLRNCVQFSTSKAISVNDQQWKQVAHSFVHTVLPPGALQHCLLQRIGTFFGIQLKTKKAERFDVLVSQTNMQRKRIIALRI